MEQRIQALPGVDSAAIADSAAPNPAALSTLLAHVQREERERTVDGTGGAVAVRMVTPQYFRALGISLLHGRSFIDEDRTSPDVRVLLSETLARLLFRDEEAVGKRIRVARGPNTYEVLQIIGVAADVKNTALTEAELPEMYMARKHKPDLTRIPPEVRRRATLIVRSALDTQTLVNSIRANIASFDPLLPVTFSTMDQQITRLAARPRFNALLLLLFATIALGLAATGMYGVVAFLVAQRTQEIGVRIAVGAQRSDIVRLMVGQAAQWSVLGIVIGLLMSVSAGRLLQGLLFQVSSRDIGAFLAATMFLTVVAVLAALVPSLRAARVDPVIALRRD